MTKTRHVEIRIGVYVGSMKEAEELADKIILENQSIYDLWVKSVEIHGMTESHDTW